MEEIRDQMNLRLIEKKLQSYSGFTFEEHARFLLKVIDPQYTFTRLRKDGKIDGYKRMGTKRSDRKNRGIKIYSVFGKEAGTVPDYNKIFSDLKDAIEYAKNHKFHLEKWSPVINFELETEFRHKLEDICEENEITFEEINPSVLITKLNNKDKVFTASCYFNATEGPMLPLTDYSYHEFARRALTRIFENNSKSTNEKFELLKEINSSILKFSFIDKKSIVRHSLYPAIGKETRIYKDFIYSYKFFNGTFLPEKNDIPGNYFTKDENGIVILQVPNLVPIFLLCNELVKQLEKSGTYEISDALDICCERSYSFSVKKMS